MQKRIFTAVHSHRHGYSHYVFAMELPEPCPDWPGGWTPDEATVVKGLDIDFEPDREEWIEVECQGTIDDIPTIAPHKGKRRQAASSK